MKKLYFPIFAICFILVQSCSKDVAKPATPASNDINVTISSNQSYEMNLTGSSASIYQQATHFKMSETLTSEDGSLKYKYIPALDFSGNDKVILANTMLVTSSNSNSGSGCPNSHQSNASNTSPTYVTTYTTVNITVAN